MGDTAEPIREDGIEETTRQEQETETLGTTDQLSDRERYMEQIALQREQTLEQPADEPIHEDGIDKPAEIRQDTTQTVKVKIDGEEKEVPLSEVVAEYQKGQTADYRLQEASRKLKGLEDKEAELTAKEAEINKNQEQIDRQTETETATDDDDAAIEEAAERLIEDGDVKPLVAAVRKVVLKELGTKGNGAPNPQEVTRLVDERLNAERQRMEHSAANAQFTKDHPDIIANPRLLQLANNIYYEKLNEGKSIGDAMAAAGKEVKELFGGGKPSTREEKQTRKESLSNLPVTGARASSRADDDRPQTTSEVIAEMRRARGMAA